MEPTDEQLVHSVAVGEEDALRVLVLRHEPRVRRYFRSRLNRVEDAEEAAQDVFLKLARGARTFNGGAFRPWLSAIARNVLRDRLRRRPGAVVEPLVADPTAGLAVYERAIRAEEVAAALASIPSAYRRALVLKYLGGLTYREGAERLGLSVKGFETRLLRAKALLRRELSRREERTR